MEPTGYDLAGRVAIVTGGGEGIGKATAMLLARYGADIAIAGRTAATLDHASAEISGATGRRCIGVPTDARDEEQVRQMVARVSAAEWGQYGIRVNAVAPGLITTENAMKTYDEHNIDPDAICAERPLQRAGTPHDVAKAIAFLASDAASYITGEVIEVSGGPLVGGQGG